MEGRENHHGASTAAAAANKGGAPGPRKKIPTWANRAELLQGEQHLIVERPQPNICMITINRPEFKNMMTHRTRAQLFNQLQVNDQDPDLRVTIIRGAGGNFCAGFDFDSNRDEVLPFFEPDIDGQTSRHVVNSWFMMNDLAKPVVAMVEGEAIGGGLELAAACDVCICTEDATLGYNSVRGQGLADYQILPWLCGMRNAMELILTNKPMTGIDAAKRHFATEAVPAAELEERTLNLALRIAKIPSDLLAFNKKSVHRAFEEMGMRTNIRNGVDLEALMFKAPGAKMLTARRGPQRGTPAAQRVPPPRPAATVNHPAVATQAVSATTSNKDVASVTAKEAPSAASSASIPQKTAPKKVAAPVATSTKAAAPVAAPIKAATPVAPSAKASAAAPAKLAGTSKAATASPVVAAKSAPAVTAKSVSSKPVTQPAATAKPVSAKTTPSPSTPAKVPIAAKTPVAAKMSLPATPQRETDNGGGVHVHLHEAVHIHITNNGNGTPSKL